MPVTGMLILVMGVGIIAAGLYGAYCDSLSNGKHQTDEGSNMFTSEQFREMREAAQRQFGGMENIFAGVVQCATPHEVESRRKELSSHLHGVQEMLIQNVSSDTGASVSLVGDVSFLDYLVHGKEMAVCAIFAVQFSDGKFGVVGHVDGEFSILHASAPDCKIALGNLSRMPNLENDDGYFNIWFTRERYVIASYNFALHQWEPNGMGYAGAAACKKFAEHGMKFNILTS